jgi:hypothetical protein
MLAMGFLVPIAPTSRAADDDFFESRIRPVLVERCQSCHGETKQWAELRLDSESAMLKGGESGPVINASAPTESELVLRVRSTDDSVRMPPPDAGPPLSEDAMRDLEHWIASGARWPKQIDAPGGSASPMSQVEKAQKEHWAFQPMVLPAIPSLPDRTDIPRAVDAFLLSKLHESGLSYSPPADRRTLIRRATYDLTGLPPTHEEVTAFEADTSADAYERLVDRLLNSPRYGEKWGRIWLDIARYADTKGYVYAREERFFTHASLYRDWVIRAFNDDLPYDQFVLLQLAADSVATEHPDALAAMGFLTLGRRFLGVTPDIMDDRIDVVSRGLLGLTVGCARCHDHKYDPIPASDYYGLYGVFQNSVERDRTPVASTSPAEESEYVRGLREREQKYREYFDAQCAEAEARFRNRIVEYLMAQRELDKYPELAFNQISTKEDLLPGTVHRWEAYLDRAEQTDDPVFVAWWAYAKLSDAEFAAKSPEVTLRLQENRQQLHPHVAAAFQEPPANAQEVAQRYGKLFAAADKAWGELCETAKREGREPPTSLPDPDDESIRLVLYAPYSPCMIPRESMANTEWLWDNGTVVELWRLQGEIDRWILQRPDADPRYLVLADQEPMFEPRVFRRGNPANKGALVPRQFLTVLSRPDQKPFQHGSGRLEMAQAIVAPSNPLTARVWVNRVWQNHFGKGLVETPSDFGVRANSPSHPELLDWLALQFISHGWSTRWLHREMMLSDAYQQSSSGLPSSGPVSEEVRSRASELDPENRWLWRMNPHRLSFEEMRDTMIALSGEVDWTMGGKATDVFAPNAEGKFRRAIYGLVDRQFLPTVFNVFDFANPDLHSPQRNETTVPQQALFQLNHPFVAGRARAIAARTESPSEDHPAARVRRLYELIYQRAPTPTQLEASLQYVQALELPEKDEAARSSEAWSYGYGAIDEASQRVRSFERLPYSANTLWQGGPQLPDAALGWVHIGAQTIHSGNDKDHSAIRRWTAPETGTIRIRSLATHVHPQGDGVRGVLISSRHGILQSSVLFNSQARFDVDALEVHAGDTLDFVVELHESLSYEDLTWAPTITWTSTVAGGASLEWDADRDFRTAAGGELTPWEQLAQVLLISNESLFLD